MLGKALFTLASLLAIGNGQILDWQNTQELDPNGTFRLFWTVIPDAGDIVLQVQAKTVGWISLTLETPTLSDVIIGGYNNTIGLPYVYDMSSTVDAAGNHGPLVVDPSPDVVLQRGFEYPPECVVRWKRSLVTGDNADVNIVPGPMIVSWAYSGGSDDLNAPLVLGGIATVTFIPL